MSTGLSLLGGTLLIAVAAIATAGLIAALRPLLRRYALARPNARSSHAEPTPQGAGLAIILMPIVWLLALAWLDGTLTVAWPLQLALALALLAVTGAFDDIRPLPVVVRLTIQLVAAALVVLAVPGDARIFPVLPHWLETAGMVIGLIWFINLTNFMDGIDGITVVEIVSVCTGLILIAAMTNTAGGDAVTPLAVVLVGALVGFAPYNKHVASVFMGDVGSLPIGALTGWMLIVIGAEGNLAAVMLLPLYYIADTTTTLYRRWRNGEKLHHAHRTHYYQLAVQRGFSVPEVNNRIFGLNIVLILLALLSVEMDSVVVDATTLIAGLILTAALLRHFERGRNV